MKNLTIKIFLILFFLLFVLPKLQSSLALESVHKYGITFPITQLGNCLNVSECKAYCNIPSNQTACINFAKAKGLIRQTATTQNNSFTQARQLLGCTSIQSCRVFCDQEENHKRCEEFAKEIKRLKTSSLKIENERVKPTEALKPTGTEEVKGVSTSNENLLQTIMQVLSTVLKNSLN